MKELDLQGEYSNGFYLSRREDGLLYPRSEKYFGEQRAVYSF